MKPIVSVKTLFLVLGFGVAATSLFLTAATVRAQDTASATTITYPSTRTVTGNFKSTDGDSGTFVETITLNSATSKSDNTVFTRAADQATRSENRNVVENSDGTRTVDYSSTDYGATASFMSHKTLAKEKHGQFVGEGTYTTAAGITGNLTTLETKAESVNVVSAVYSSSSVGITNDLRLEDDGFGFVTVKTIHLAPDGKATTVVHTRYITGK